MTGPNYPQPDRRRDPVCRAGTRWADPRGGRQEPDTPIGELIPLHTLEPGDAEAVWRWNNDPDVVRWMTDVYPEPLAEVTKRFAERPPSSYEKVLLAVEAAPRGG